MSEISVTVRDTTQALHGRIHGSRVDYLVAALSADPETIAELRAALARAAEPAGEEPPEGDRVRAIHARWLTTPRDDLGGLAPRDVLLRRRDHIMWDMQDRCEQWTVQHAAPPVLANDTAAYRFGGF